MVVKRYEQRRGKDKRSYREKLECKGEKKVKKKSGISPVREGLG